MHLLEGPGRSIGSTVHPPGYHLAIYHPGNLSPAVPGSLLPSLVLLAVPGSLLPASLTPESVKSVKTCFRGRQEGLNIL